MFPPALLALTLVVPSAVGTGDLFAVRVPGGEPAPAAVEFMGKRYPAIAGGQGGEVFFLLGVDLDGPAGDHPLTAVYDPGEGRAGTQNIHVRERDFPVERLTLKQEMVTPPPEVLERIAQEREAAAEVYRTTAPGALWEPPFARPVDGTPSGNFGRRRILNGEPRSPHSGEDWSAPRGEEVRAVSAGRVRMARDLYFSGKTVLIDHGAGLVSQYFHLDRLLVTEGQAVSRGEPVGTVGSTGRVTGPHLHFGVRLFSQRVDPSSLWVLFTRESGEASPLPLPSAAR